MHFFSLNRLISSILFILLFFVSHDICFAKPKNIYLGHYSGFNIFGENQNKKTKGLGHDSLMELAHEANVNVNLVDLKIHYAEALQQGIVDVVGLIVPLPQFDNVLSFSKNAFGYAQFGLATKNNHNAYYDDPESINGKKVATFYGNNANKFFNDYLEKNNISVEYVYSDLDNYTSLDADFYLIFSSILNINEFEIVLNLGKAPLHFATKKGNEVAMKELDNAYLELSERKNSIINRIKDKYKKIDAKFDNRPLTRKEAKLLRDKTFSVGFIKNGAPYQYVDEHGREQGICIDILDKLAKKYQFNVNYVPYEAVNGIGLVDFTKIDLLLSLIGSDKQIRNLFQNTDAYYHLPMVLLSNDRTTANIQDILEKTSKIGIVHTISFDYSEFNRLIPKAELVHYNTVEHLLAEFKSGNIDAVILTSANAHYVHTINSKRGQVYPLDLELPIKIFIAHGLADPYVDVFNVMLANISYQSLHETLFTNTSNHSPKIELIDVLIENWIYIVAAILSIFFLAAIYLMRVQMNKKNEILNLLYTDDITSLISMNYFRVQVNQCLEKAMENEYEIISLDIDYFRIINKHYGMEIGTKVITKIGKALLQAYAGTDAIISRKHSEQFVIFKKNNIDKTIQEVVNGYVEPTIREIVGKNYSLTMSIGIYPIVNPKEEINDMIDFADIARKRGKAYHKITYVTFSETMRNDFYETINIVHRMESALKDEEFTVIYQPKVCFESLKIIGAEALVRWIPADGKPIYPDKFISTMETDGFVTKLDLYVFEKVCQFINHNAIEYTIPQIAVNMSAVTMSEEGIVEQLVKITEKYKILPSKLEIELTESALNTLQNSIIVNITALKLEGFSIAMDDFGTGESSLNRLSMTHVDVLKLDKSFLDFNQDSARGHIVVKKIIELAKHLNLKIVSEGVETLEQVLWLRELKCHIAQGYYFSRPINAENFKKLLQDDITYELIAK